MLYRDIQPYCPGLRAYHCGIWYLVTIFVDDLPHYIKKNELYRVSQKKGIDKKPFFGAAQGLNIQFLNLFGFSISVSFVWCII